MEAAKKELNQTDNLLLEKFYMLKRKECDAEFELYELMKIYDKI